MKKSIVQLVLAALLVSSPAMAQEGAPVIASVTYEFIHVADTNHADQPLKEMMELQLSETHSRYRRKPLTSAPVQNTGQQAPRATISVSGGPMVVVNGPGITTTELYQYPKDGKLNMVASIGRQGYLIELDLPKIKWSIGTATKKIGDYNCQQATGAYAGRTYTAWFTTELPFQNGPWKLSGLPGLVLEATDAKKEVQFLFKEINKDTAAITTKTTKERLVTTTEKAFQRASEAFFEDPVAGMQAQLPPTAPPVQIAYRDASGKSTVGENAKVLIEKNKKEAKTSNNNPLELTGK